MKVIDLLNKIANGEESDLITEFEFDERIWNFYKLQDSEYCVVEWLLNQEIVITKHQEIIEDKKIEKLREPFLQEETLNYVKLLKSKINELIDKINEEK